VRVFAGRNSLGVRGITLAEGDRLISMAILRHMEATPAERGAFLRLAAAERRGEGDDGMDVTADEEGGEAADLSAERLAELRANEEFVLTVSEFGYGKRTSSYDFRVTSRGGKGIRATDVSKAGEIGRLVAAFPVETEDQVMLVTNGGQVIRVPVGEIRIASRATKGVKIFSTGGEERVVSVERISEPAETIGEGDSGEGAG
jgi:DNA gyrase subunit A